MSADAFPSRGPRRVLQQNAPQGADVDRERAWALMLERTRKARRQDLDALAAPADTPAGAAHEQG